MIDLPCPILDYLLTLTSQERSPAYLLVNEGGRLSDWGGKLEVYGLSDLERNKSIESQVYFLEGLLPLNGPKIVLPSVKTEHGHSADIHLFHQEDKDWILLLDATPVEIQSSLVQQRANELSLLRERQSRILDQHLEKDVPKKLAHELLTTDGPLLSNLFNLLNIAVFVRLNDGSFKLEAPPPTWFLRFYPDVLPEKAGFRPEEKFHFLENFLIDAEAFWTSNSVGQLRSGLWCETDLSGEELYFEATAVCLGNRKVLLLEFPVTAYEEKRSLLQEGREKSLKIVAREREAKFLRQAKDELELRVQERTAELAEANRQLQRELLERKQAEQAARESAALLEAQNQVLVLVAWGAPLRDTLHWLLRVIEAQCPGMFCSILLLDPDGIHVRHGAAPSLPESFTRGIDGEPIGPRAGSCGTAAFRREPVVVEDIAADPLWDIYRDLALRHGLRACWSTPIFDGQGCVLGTFALYFRTPGRPTERHWQLIEMATNTAAIAIIKHRETEALRASEERLRLAVTGGNVGIWEWDVGNDRLVWSDQLKALFGWPAETGGLTLKTFMDAIHPEDRPGIDAALRRALSEHTDYDVEYRILWPDGSLHWIAAKGRGEYNADGRPVRMTGVGLDVTDRKRAEEEINRREAQLAEAQRIAQLGSYEWDTCTNTVYRSEELCRIFGLPPDQFEPTFEGYLERVHPEDRSSTKNAIEQAFRECKPFEFEERIVRPDGAIRVLHSQGKWVWDKAQHPVKLVGICQDVTERKQAEDLLRRSEERFQIVARATNDAIWDWDLVTNVIWWNQGITTLFEYPAEEIGQDIAWWSERVHPDDLDRVVSGIRAVTDRGEQFWSSEYRFRRAGGSYADIFDRGFVIYDDGRKPVRMIGTMADISERKQALETLEQRVASRTADLQSINRELEHEISRRQRVEELLRGRNKELKAFAYTVSHDLKAPLRGIAGYAQELDRRHRAGLSERAHFCLTQILTATQNLDCLIEDLLHYSRLDTETPSNTDVNLAHLIEAILRDRKPMTLEQGTEVVVSLSSTSVRTWERGLLQVLTNLIDNALKYSRNAKPPCVQVSSQELPDAFRIKISDNGIGFDMKYHDRIFGLFNRLVRQEEFEGTGAGLAIVKKVVEKLGGRVWAESKPGAGATFFVELPKA